MTPGEWRSQPPSRRRGRPPSAAVERARRRLHATFRERYRFAKLGKAGRIMAMAAAHHRFNYIHPFPDGNGRVSRLMSHAMALAGRHRRPWPVVGLARPGARSRKPRRIQADDGPRGHAAAGRSRRNGRDRTADGYTLLLTSSADAWNQRSTITSRSMMSRHRTHIRSRKRHGGPRCQLHLSDQFRSRIDRLCKEQSRKSQCGTGGVGNDFLGHLASPPRAVHSRS